MTKHIPSRTRLIVRQITDSQIVTASGDRFGNGHAVKPVALASALHARAAAPVSQSLWNAWRDPKRRVSDDDVHDILEMLRPTYR